MPESLVGRKSRSRLSLGIFLTADLATTLLGHPAAAQERPDNIYRYVLDIDIPESPGLVALDLLSTKVLRGSAPKPFTANVIHRSADSSRSTTGAALDFVPYHLLGGGMRRLSSYRSNSIAGRLLRVLTKTAISVAVASPGGTGESLLGALAVRTTFHDPHDPILNSRLPETLDSLLKAHGVGVTDPTEEHLGNRGVDLEPEFAAVSRRMRARGDIQVSAGWGLAGLLRGGSLNSDSLDEFRHTLWLTGQHATGHRFDVIATVQLQPAFRGDDHWRFGAGIQRKSLPADLRLQLYYDTGSRRVHPGLVVEGHLTRGFLVGAGLTSEAAAGGVRRSSVARFALTAQWYPTAPRKRRRRPAHRSRPT
jgi:hypothetical protein